MKKFLLSLATICTLASCSKHQPVPNASGSDFPPAIDTSYSKKDTLEKLLQQYVKLGVPGAVIAVLSPEGYWGASKGFSKIETQSPMKLSQLQYLQSISKTYMA